METQLPLIEQYIQQITTHLSSILPPAQGPSKTLCEAGYYSILSGGKRIRPLLAALILIGHKKEINPYLNILCALELIHTYSLIHDDLPCMDDDDMRRGQPSLHKAFSESTAVLTGDYLLTYAFELITSSPSVEASIRSELVLSLARYAGANGLIGGQVEDLSFDRLSIIETEEMYAKKTGALFSCSLDFGALLVEDTRPRKWLQKLGYHMGVVYQYLDDLDDGDISKYGQTKEEMLTRCQGHLGHIKKMTATLPSEYQLVTTFIFNLFTLIK